MRRTLDSVVAQSIRPTVWIIVDDGSTDATPEILRDYAERHAWIKTYRKPDRGHRAVGPGVIDAFYFGLEHTEIDDFAFICKLDLDLDLPSGYFEGLIQRMEADPRLGTCSGKAYYAGPSGEMISEGIGDEMSVGASKFFRTTCFKEIGGFVREVMWDGIDCHKTRQLGWTAASWDDPALRFEHLRPMGSSQTSIFTGRRRHGFGQYYMGSDPLYFFATVVHRLGRRPFILGALATLQGYVAAWWRGDPQHDDPELQAFIRRYQRRALIVGKARAVAEIDARNASSPPAAKST